jgi:cytochrome c biogenesis protein CcmG/thiol:disulfide interchange protein DsbE
MPFRFLLPLLILAALAALLWFGLFHGNQREISSPLIGKPAPAFALPAVADPQRTVSSDTWRGRPYLLNVWATWCVGCREEHELLVEIARSNVVPIVGLNWKDDRALAIGWLRQLGNPYTEVAFDELGRVAIDWGVYGAPETFLVDADGRVAYKHIGPLTRDKWQRDFLPRLRSTGTSP